jgi:hypothetical protein
MSTGNQVAGGSGPQEMLLDQVRRVMRVQRYSIHSERTYVDWIRRYAKFHRMRSRADLDGGEAKIEAFLTELAIQQNVAPATQNAYYSGGAFRRSPAGVCWGSILF